MAPGALTLLLALSLLPATLAQDDGETHIEGARSSKVAPIGAIIGTAMQRRYPVCTCLALLSTAAYGVDRCLPRRREARRAAKGAKGPQLYQYLLPQRPTTGAPPQAHFLDRTGATLPSRPVCAPAPDIHSRWIGDNPPAYQARPAADEEDATQGGARASSPASLCSDAPTLY
ncbi:hypothetical protein GGX14DRAFT_620453 [Mycena pura]|uniref:Uncharacterized protein n=1 Tax=Mycena pura TaxID=153505 RepID=A0AAD6VIS8_9AGAR|nr:hypothetical protein GGX14DRAFT_620453 [Mycena pura]